MFDLYDLCTSLNETYVAQYGNTTYAVGGWQGAGRDAFASSALPTSPFVSENWISYGGAFLVCNDGGLGVYVSRLAACRAFFELNVMTNVFTRVLLAAT